LANNNSVDFDVSLVLGTSGFSMKIHKRRKRRIRPFLRIPIQPEGAFNPTVVPKAHQNWMQDRPVFYADSYRLFVHAGADPSLPLEKQNDQTLMWMRYASRAAGLRLAG
jgi:hypothetical protein